MPSESSSSSTDFVCRVAGNEYLTGLTLYFIGYVLFEVGRSRLQQPSTDIADDIRSLAISY